MPPARQYPNPDDFAEAVAEYFDTLGERPPTISGLAGHLDLSRQSLWDYGKRAGYEDVVRRARQRVEIHLEEQLLVGSGRVAGVIFNLKNNFGWKDKFETEHTGGLHVNVVRFGDDQPPGE